MTTATSSLLSPLRFRNGVIAKNRLALAPMTNLQSHADGSLSDDELAWLAMRARGGFGTITTCAAHVAKDGQGWPGELGVFDDALVPGLARVAAMAREHGALSIAQIFHGGARAPSACTGEQPWSASAFVEDSAGFEPPRAGTVADVERVIGQFRDAAVRCERAGLDGVELHGAHGYLLSQFLSRTFNLREDAWGGDLVGRARLVREVTRAVRGAVSPRFVLGVRISPEDFGNARGLDLDESLQVARWLVEDGIDFLHLSLWRSELMTKKRPEAHAVPLFRDVVSPDVPIVVAGNVWTRADAEGLLSRGADAIALGRAAIGNPDWPVHVTDASWAPKRPPYTVADLRERGLSPTFAEYMRRWKGFVAEGA